MQAMSCSCIRALDERPGPVEPPTFHQESSKKLSGSFATCRWRHPCVTKCSVWVVLCATLVIKGLIDENGELKISGGNLLLPAIEHPSSEFQLRQDLASSG